MFGFIKKVFIIIMTFFNANALEFASMNNQGSKIITKITNISNNEPTFYPISISVNKLQWKLYKYQ